MASANLSPVIICPAQFGVAKDYDSLIAQLEAIGHPAVVVAPLSRFCWLRILPSAVSPEFWQSALPMSPTLDFYFEALDKAVAEVQQKCGSDTPVTIVGHSIGGWIMRAFLTQRPEVRAATDLICSLGTPNRTPPEGTIWANVDQTRGLLKGVNEAWASLDARPPTVCVIGTGTEGGFSTNIWDENSGRSTTLERALAGVSYLALCGNAFCKGDGLIPVEASTVDSQGEGDEVKTLLLEDCNHSGFIPTALDSILLPKTYKWYGSPDMIEQWTPLLRASS